MACLRLFCSVSLTWSRNTAAAFVKMVASNHCLRLNGGNYMLCRKDPWCKGIACSKRCAKRSHLCDEEEARHRYQHGAVGLQRIDALQTLHERLLVLLRQSAFGNCAR